METRGKIVVEKDLQNGINSTGPDDNPTHQCATCSAEHNAHELYNVMYNVCMYIVQCYYYYYCELYSQY